VLTEEMATAAGPFIVGNIDSNDADSSFNLSLAAVAAACLSTIDAVARACSSDMLVLKIISISVLIQFCVLVSY